MDITATYLDQINHPVLSRKEERDLAKKIEEGGPGSSEARDKLIRHNLRLVVSFVSGFVKKWGTFGLSLLELYGIGNEIIIEFIDRIADNHPNRFDWRRGIKFSTFFRWFFFRKFSNGVCEYKNRTIHHPYWMLNSIHANQRAKKGLEPVSVVSLTVPRRSPGINTSFQNEVPDFCELDPAIEFERKIDGVTFQEVLATIKKLLPDERHFKILCMRFGLNGYEPHNLTEIAAKVNGQTTGESLSKERVRQLLTDLIIPRLQRAFESLRKKDPRYREGIFIAA